MEISDVNAELLLISSFYKNKETFVRYVSLIDTYLIFSCKKTRVLYRIISEYYTQFDEFKEIDFRLYLKEDKENLESYLEIGGIESIEALMGLEDHDVKHNFETVRKYALLREYSSIGFDVERIMRNESFSKISARKISDIVKTLVDNTRTKVDGNIDENTTITEDATGFVIDFLKAPEIGLSFGTASLNNAFRGFRKGQLVVEGLLSNSGKTRRMIAIATHLAFVEKAKVFIMSNEMTYKDIKSAVLITILNHPKFWKLANSKNIFLNENDMRLGLYKDSNGNYIYRNKDESDDDYIMRVKTESSQFMEIFKMLTWVEKDLNIKYKNMKQYSDSDIEIEIRKEHYGNNCDYIFYDTLKSFKSSEWGMLKQTATSLSEMAKSLKIGIYANLQLSDTSHEVNIFDMDSRNIASAKHVYHVLDSFVIGKKLNVEEYKKYEYITRRGNVKELDEDETYYGFKIAKSRSAGDKISKDSVIIYRVDLNRNLWIDLGILSVKKY